MSSNKAQPNKMLLGRVDRAVGTVLGRDGRVTYAALFQELGILQPRDLEARRAGRVPYLEKVIRSNLTKCARIQKAMRKIASARGLQRSVAGPKRDRRYSKTGNPFVEEEYHAVYLEQRLNRDGDA